MDEDVSDGITDQRLKPYADVVRRPLANVAVPEFRDIFCRAGGAFIPGNSRACHFAKLSQRFVESSNTLHSLSCLRPAIV